MTKEKKWYVSLGDGTFVEMDERPFVFEATDDAIKLIETQLGGEAPIDCVQGESAGIYTGHIHIRDLVERSHWDDHTPVVDRTTPDRINS